MVTYETLTDLVEDATQEVASIPTRVRAEAVALALADFSRSARRGAIDPRIASLRAPSLSSDVAVWASLAAAASSLGDTHLHSGTHPGIMVVPAAFAHVQGVPRLTSAVALGYAVCARVGTNVIRSGDPNVRPSSIAGSAGAAAAAAAARGIVGDELTSAISFAIQAAGGRNDWVERGTDDEIAHAGLAVTVGLAAPTLVAAGLRGASLRLGWSGTDGAAPAILDLYRKSFESCIFAQTPAQCAQVIHSKLGSTPHVLDVEVVVSTRAATQPGCDNPSDLGERQRQIMSIQFAVAAALAGHSERTPVAREELSAVLELAALVRVEALEELNTLECDLRVTLADGRHLQEHGDLRALDAASTYASAREMREHTLAPVAVRHMLRRIDEAVDRISA